MTGSRKPPSLGFFPIWPGELKSIPIALILLPLLSYSAILAGNLNQPGNSMLLGLAVRNRAGSGRPGPHTALRSDLRRSAAASASSLLSKSSISLRNSSSGSPPTTNRSDIRRVSFQIDRDLEPITFLFKQSSKLVRISAYEERSYVAKIPIKTTVLRLIFAALQSKEFGSPRPQWQP